jgi:hypothetical protein
MAFVPRDASDDEILAIIREWVDALSREDYEGVFEALGYAVAFDRSGAECIRGEIKRYRSAKLFPGVEEFTVSDWRTAQGGNPSPTAQVTWYKINSTRLAGAVDFDLPLNGRWSDLSADFVLIENDNLNEGYFLGLEEISQPLQETE